MDNVNKLGKQERTYQVTGRQSGQPKVCRHFHIYKDQRISHLASIHRTRVENKGIDATKSLVGLPWLLSRIRTDIARPNIYVRPPHNSPWR